MLAPRATLGRGANLSYQSGQRALRLQRSPQRSRPSGSSASVSAKALRGEASSLPG